MKIIFNLKHTLGKLGLQTSRWLSTSRLTSTFISTRRYSSIGTTDANIGTSSTVDSSEIDHFLRDAQCWWDLKGPMKGLHTFNEIRVPFIVDNLANKSENSEAQSIDKKILDVGCGGGVLSEALAKCGMTVTGIDFTPKLIDIAKEHCLISMTNQDIKIKPIYYVTTIENHAENYKNHYDAVVASEVIEHVNSQDIFVKSCVEVLKPGGQIFFTTPSRTRISQLVNIWFAENFINCPPKGTHQYEKFITPRHLQKLLESNGCKVEEIRGFLFNMLTNTWSWIPTKILFFAIRATKFQ